VARLRDEEWMTLWIITAGMMVALGIQIVFVRDHLSGGDWERMNTVFKFGLQIWTLLAIGAAAALPRVASMLRRAGEGVLAAWYVPLLVLVLAGLVYPFVGIPSRVGLRFTPHPGLTLDGLAFMQTARYEHEDRQLDLAWDADAIRWLKRNLHGLPVVLQSEGEFYRNYGVRIAANTGFPTVLGRLHQDEQRPAAPVLEREKDVKTIFSTADTETARDLLAKYQVEYVYIGQHERLFYGTEGLAKWDALVGSALDLAYENPGVRIYRVRPGLRRQPQRLPSTRPSDESVLPADDGDVVAPAGPDTGIEALEAAHQARPEDGPTAFGLALRYVQAGRLDEAATVLSAAAPSNTNDVPLQQLLGDIQAGLGRADEAIRAWQTAVDFAPTAGNISKLGTGLTQLGRYDEAERVLRRAQETDPQDVLVHFYLAEVAFKRSGPGDEELARQEYSLYLEQSPDDSPFRPAAEQALRQLGR
jgi:Flp pilus assembly protein TadD